MAGPHRAFDPLGWAVVTGNLIVGLLAIVQVLATGSLDAGVLALLGGVNLPLIPVFVARYRRNGTFSDQDERTRRR